MPWPVFLGGLTLTAIDRLEWLVPQGVRRGLTHTLIDHDPCLSSDLSAAREPCGEVCLTDACDPRRA